MIDRLVLLGVSHQTAPLAIRERIVRLSEDATLSPERLRELPGVSEGMLLSTCNRVELYGAGQPAERVADGFRQLMASEPAILPHLYERRGEAALRHLFRVASSLDSMVVGEPQILGQLKQAFQRASASGITGDTLHRAVGRAFAVAKRVRTETAVGRAAVSMVHAALELSERVFDSLAGKRVLLFGAGEMSTLAAQRLVAQRRRWARHRQSHPGPRAQALADRFAGSAVSVSALPLEGIDAHLVWADLILSAAAADRLLLTHEELRPKLRARRYRPLMCIDLAVPRSLDSQLGSLENVYVKDVDDVGQLVASNVAKRSEEAKRAERIVDSEVQIFTRVLRGRSIAPVLAALRQRGDRVAREEAQRTLQRIGASLTEEQGRSVEAMAQAIVKKLLHEPTVRLRAAAEAQETSVLADAAGELFGLGDSALPDSTEGRLATDDPPAQRRRRLPRGPATEKP